MASFKIFLSEGYGFTEKLTNALRRNISFCLNTLTGILVIWAALLTLSFLISLRISFRLTKQKWKWGTLLELRKAIILGWFLHLVIAFKLLCETESAKGSVSLNSPILRFSSDFEKCKHSTFFPPCTKSFITLHSHN